MTRIPHYPRGAAPTGKSFTNSVAALGDDDYYVKTKNSIHGKLLSDLHHEQQQQKQYLLDQHHRRLEDYYAYNTPDDGSLSSTTQHQHPWYTHGMLLLFMALVVFIVLYALYELYQSRQIRSILLKAHCATRPLCDDDMSDVYSMQPSTTSQQQQPAAEGADASGCSMASSEWKNTTPMEMVFPSSNNKPSYDDEASASSLSPRNHNDYISMSGGGGGGGGSGNGGASGDREKSGVAV